MRKPLVLIPFELSFASLSKSWWVTPDEQNMFSWLNRGALCRRGWVHQERQLARRVLHFAENEIVWECCSRTHGFASETFPHGSPESATRSLLGDNKFQARPAWTDRDGRNAGLYRLWLDLCISYSAKLLTKPDDRVVALSGLAKGFEEALSDRYVAGCGLRIFRAISFGRLMADAQLSLQDLLRIGRRHGPGYRSIARSLMMLRYLDVPRRRVLSSAFSMSMLSLRRLTAQVLSRQLLLRFVACSDR